jgi:hypothetical protein
MLVVGLGPKISEITSALSNSKRMAIAYYDMHFQQESSFESLSTFPKSPMVGFTAA